MNRDLIIGILFSIIFHVGFLWGGEILFGRTPTVVSTGTDDTPTIEIVQMPEMEPDEPEVFETSDEAPAEPIDFAPPMQADVVSVVVDTSFVQKLQPPPPPGLERPQGVITIPKTSTGRAIGSGMKDLFDLASLDQQPAARFQAKPVYPFEMRRAGITGEVLVGFIVDSNGDVREAYPIRSTQREFEQAAVQAVSKWKFRPGRKGGRAVNTRMQVPIVFSISDD
jgi:periplasmic protein TonB